jgi:hypothetical protein
VWPAFWLRAVNHGGRQHFDDCHKAVVVVLLLLGSPRLTVGPQQQKQQQPLRSDAMWSERDCSARTVREAQGASHEGRIRRRLSEWHIRDDVVASAERSSHSAASQSRVGTVRSYESCVEHG